MESEKFKKFRTLPVLILIAAFYILLHLLGVNCPIRFLTGVSCPGCGMTRAWISVLRGNFSAAFSYHPLFLTMIPAVIVILFRERIPKRLFNGLTWVLIILFLAVYLYRMFFSDGSVVAFRPCDGAIYRVIQHMRS